MLAHERPVTPGGGKGGAVGERQPQRRRVGPQRIIWLDRAGDQIRVLRLDPLIDVLAVIAVRPTVEGARRHRRHIVGHQIVADLVAFVDRNPQLAALGVPGQPDGVTQSGRVDPARPCHPVDLEDVGTIGFFGHAEVRHVRVRSYADIQLGPVRTGDQTLGPVVVSLSRQVGQLGGRGRDGRLALDVGEADHCIGVGNIDSVADQSHAERRHQARQELGLQLRDAIAIRVTQQQDFVGAGRHRAGLLHEQALEEALDAFRLALGLRRRIGLCDQNVAVGQAVEPTRVIEARGERLHFQPRCGDRHGPRWPTHGGGDLDRREEGLVRRR